MRALARCFLSTLDHIRRERGALTTLVAASLLYALFYPSPYLHQVLRNVPVVLVDRDHTQLSRLVARWLDASEGLAITRRSNDLQEARDAVRAGDAGGIVLIPKDFERRVRRREPAYLTAYADGSYLLVYSTVNRTVSTVTRTLSAGVTVQRQPVTLANWPLFNPLAGYANFVIPAAFILVLQQTLLIGIGTLRVAERHSPDELKEPIWAVLGGKAAVLVLIYLLHAAFMFLVAFRLFHLPLRADPGTVAVFLIPFIISVTLLGLVIAELFGHSESSTLALVLTSLPALFLSGISFPIDTQAGWVRAIALAFPTTFGIRGFLQIGEMGGSLGDAWRAWGALWLQVLVYGLGAAFLMRRARRMVAPAAEEQPRSSRSDSSPA